MIGACSIDQPILLCLARYHPEFLLLALLALIFCACLWKFMV